LNKPASAGRDRKRQALFDRCFRKKKESDERKEKKKKRGDRDSNGKDDENGYFLVLDGKIPPPVYLKKPKWDQYLIKKM
jgi:hypothetical protein